MTKEHNPYETTKWGVFIYGSGSILAAESFEQAAENTAEFNKMIADHIKPISGTLHPLIYAVTARWEDIAGNTPHRPEETDWNNMV